jgi:D-3-phosphoglycerate dehydrogenase
LSKDGLTTEMQHLINSKKTILSPHIAGWTHESNIKIAKNLLGKITSSLQ